MSSISSLPSLTVNLSNYQQAINNTPAIDVTTAVPPNPSDPSTTQGATGEHHHHHHHGGGVSSQIESAITSALQSVQPGQDPNEVIKNAISTALQNASSASTTTTPPATTDPSTATATTTDPTATSPTDFDALLKSFNVDPQQFHKDFQSAIQSVQQDGNVDFATLFHSFPPGSAIDSVG